MPPTLSAAMGAAASADLVAAVDLDALAADRAPAADRADLLADAARDLASTRSAARVIAEANKIVPCGIYSILFLLCVTNV